MSKKEKKDNKVILKDRTLKYVYLINPKKDRKLENGKTIKGDREVTINVSAEDIKALEAKGVPSETRNPSTNKVSSRYKQDSELGTTLTVHNPLKNAAGEDFPAIKLFDKYGEPLPTGTLIGSGSKGHVEIWVTDSGAPRIGSVMITELVEVERKSQAALIFGEETVNMSDTERDQLLDDLQNSI
jgi:hypothetical protein